MTNTTQGLNRGAILLHGTYRIERVLGQGGFGITYLATDLNLDRPVAIKEFFPKDYCDRNSSTSHVTLGTQSAADFVNRLKAKFLKEAKNIAKFDHPGIIRIHGAFEENNTAYYVMDYIEGESLSEMVKRSGPLPRERALAYISKVADALDYVHSRRINHLDVKPANIMIRRSDDSPILIDFGLSKQYDSSGNQTSTTPTGISHGYAPMEQYNDGGVKEFSPQTDLYSLAATLYYLLSGVTPPQATKLIEDDLTFPASILNALIGPLSRAMSSRRSDRHPSVRDFIREISTATPSDTHTDATTFPQTPTPTPKPQPAKASKIPYIIAACVAVAAVIAGIILHKPNSASTTTNTNSHEWVDLGLSVKWATCNVGATSPEDYGNYFAWGETRTKSSYDETNSKTYGKSVSELQSEGIINGKGELTMRYDAARANWGGTWRMPTKAEFDELCSKCTWTWTTQGGKKGYKVTGPNGNSIFLPAAGGCGYYNPSLDDEGEEGFYWSSTEFDGSDYASGLYFRQSHHTTHWNRPGWGFPVRPVSE